MKKTVIIALGGNALSPKNEAGTIDQQFKHRVVCLYNYFAHTNT